MRGKRRVTVVVLVRNIGRSLGIPKVERTGFLSPSSCAATGTGFLLKNSAVFFSPGFEVSSGKDLIIPDDTDNGTASPSHRSHYVRSSGRGQTSGENKPMINALSSPSLPNIFRGRLDCQYVSPSLRSVVEAPPAYSGRPRPGTGQAPCSNPRRISGNGDLMSSERERLQ